MKTTHQTCAVGDQLPPRYFSPPSPAETPVNKVTAFFPPLGFTGTFKRAGAGQPWIRT